MGTIVFLVTQPERGSVSVIGPETGISYTITSQGTPVNSADVEGLLKMTGPPCCGKALPFGAELKLFGVMSATVGQLASAPAWLADADRVKAKTVKEDKEPVVEKPTVKAFSKEDFRPRADKKEEESEE